MKEYEDFKERVASVNLSAEDIALNRKMAMEALRTHPRELQARRLADPETGATCALGTMLAGVFGVPVMDIYAYSSTWRAQQALARAMGLGQDALEDVPAWNDTDRLTEDVIAENIEKYVFGEGDL